MEGHMPVLLLALFLAWTHPVRAQSTTPLAGSDSSETSAAAKGMPWIAHTSADAFLLASPSAPAGSRPYQISTYQAFTIQSLSFASFHAGWRYRETLAEGLSAPYRELFALKLMGTAEILRDHLFLSLGGSIPLFEASLAEEDTAALYRHLSGYNPLPAPNFVTPQGLQVGIFGRYRLGDWDLLAAANYFQPTRFEPVRGHPFSPASRLGGALRAIFEGGRSRHRYDAKLSRFGREETLSAIPAHVEGVLYQARYAWLRSRGRTAWQLGGGAAVKWLDENRPLRLPTPLLPTDGNDNVQRAYAEAALTWTPRPDRLWRLWLLPKALLLPSARESGHETEAGIAYGMRLWEVHRLRASGSVLFGSFLGRDYLGFGLRAEFAFRHLGFQDLEAQGEGGGN